MGQLSIRVPVMLLHHPFLIFFLIYCAVWVNVHGAILGTSNSIHTVRAEIDLSG